MFDLKNVRTIKDVCLELGINRLNSFVDVVNTAKNELVNFCKFVMIEVLLLFIVLMILPFLDADEQMVVWICYVFINFWITIFINTVPKLIFLLISMPVFVATVYLGNKVPSDFFEGLWQFIILLISYAVVWGWGAIIFNDKEYKVAMSFVDAFLTTVLAIVAYICYMNPSLITKYITTSTVEIYKPLSIVFSPFVIARVWGKWALDLMELIDVEGLARKKIKETLKDYF